MRRFDFTVLQIINAVTCDFYSASSYASVILAVVILSVRPSIRLSVRGKTKQCTADILIPHERAITLLFCNQQWFVGDVLFF